MDWMYEFPLNLSIDLEAIDSAVTDLSIRWGGFFGAIKGALNGFVGGINSLLLLIPWFVLVLAVGLLMWRVSKKWTSAIFYGVLLFLIGAVGLWDLMLETLSIIIVSVIIALVLGFPIGILVSMSDRFDRIVRPILDTMQTMPVFVYLIPAMVFFGLGKPPVVIATTIYPINR